MAKPQRPLHELTDLALERELTELGRHLALPSTPDITGAVRRAVAERPTPTVTHAKPFPIRRLLVAAAVVILALVAGLLLSDGVRTTVADLFGVRGVRITIERDEPTATSVTSIEIPATPVGTNLLLGQRLSMSEAQHLVGFPIGIPASLGVPDEVYVRRLSDDKMMVSLLYKPRPGLPETAETGAGALMMQFGTTQPIALLGKQIAEGYQLSFDTVHGKDAIWISGAHGMTLFSDPSRGCCDDTGRAAGNVLLWEQGDQTFRFESALSKDAAIAIAESVRLTSATAVPDLNGN